MRQVSKLWRIRVICQDRLHMCMQLMLCVTSTDQFQFGGNKSVFLNWLDFLTSNPLWYMLDLARIHIDAAGLGALLVTRYALRKLHRIASLMLTHALLFLSYTPPPPPQRAPTPTTALPQRQPALPHRRHRPPPTPSPLILIILNENFS